MSHIKNLFFDELAKAVQPVPFLAAPPLPMGLHSAWLDREGVQLLCYFEPPSKVTRVYVRDVNILPLLPHDMLAGIEYEIMGDDA